MTVLGLQIDSDNDKASSRIDDMGDRLNNLDALKTQ